MSEKPYYINRYFHDEIGIGDSRTHKEVRIPAEHRKDVALALLGGVDKLAEDLSDALGKTTEDWWISTEAGCAAVKRTLAAIFGPIDA